ncbi:MAG: DUF6036 family nucleotidyltransferase [Luteolibacter sp.]|uniref:DUF6036 family nucleotidyltransferase n=1 Tax=Luteolibacter sp. TaxID=1962973 RepID=UPI00326386A3
MRASQDNPTEVLLALDRELDHEVSLVLYGRAALCLGFADAPAEFGTTQDVDGIIRLSQLPVLMEDSGFWEAQERANRILEPRGLYITHLFSEDQVFLRPQWEEHLVPVLQPETRWLRLFRPHAVDLILTKMMRGNDPQDMEDVAFLVTKSGVTLAEMEVAFQEVRMPDLHELRDAFERALPRVREILDRNGLIGS